MRKQMGSVLSVVGMNTERSTWVLITIYSPGRQSRLQQEQADCEKKGTRPSNDKVSMRKIHHHHKQLMYLIVSP
jgi:hypothetical protein